MKTVKKKVALFRNTPYFDVDCVATDSLEGTSYVRVSEYVETEFPMLDIGVDQQVAILDERQAKMTEEHNKRLSEIEQQKNRLTRQEQV